jgi:hypothetical protein
MGNGPELHSLIPLGDFKAVLGIDDREDCLDFASVQNQGYEFLRGKNSRTLLQPPSMAAFCLVTATYTIEQYCKRRLLRKKRFEFLPFYGDYIFPLQDYPVREVELCYAQLYAVYQTHALKESIIVEPDFYHTMPPCSRRAQGNYNNHRPRGLCLPECGGVEDIPFCLSASPALGLGDFFVNGGSTEPHAMPHYSSTRSLFRVPYRAWLVRDLSGMKIHYRTGYVPGKVPADLASACLELAAWNMARFRGRRIGMTENVRGSGKKGKVFGTYHLS